MPPRLPHPKASRCVVLATVIATALLPACNRDGRPGKLDLPRDAGVAELAVDPALRFVTVLSTLRREPVEKTPNGLAVLHRGERVTFLEVRGDWNRVRASDGVEGWLKGSALLPASEVQEGTVLVVAWAFDRPDLLAANARRKLDPGTLLFIRKTKDLFTEVDAGNGPPTWILTDRVTVQPGDVGAAKLVEKARFLRRSDRPAEALEVLSLLRSRAPDSPLVPILAAELGELPPGGGAPEGATGPSGPSGPSPSPDAPTRTP
jgi:SH3-like domain-containing protein